MIPPLISELYPESGGSEDEFQPDESHKQEEDDDESDDAEMQENGLDDVDEIDCLSPSRKAASKKGKGKVNAKTKGRGIVQEVIAQRKLDKRPRSQSPAKSVFLPHNNSILILSQLNSGAQQARSRSGRSLEAHKVHLWRPTHQLGAYSQEDHSAFASARCRH